MSTGLYVRFAQADYYFRRGQNIVNTRTLTDVGFMDGVSDLKRATELNPWLIDYLTQRCDVIFRVSAQTSVEQGRQLIDKTIALTTDAVRIHPGNPSAHELRSTALMLSAGRFGSSLMPEAFNEIKIASALDPTFIFTLRRRMEIARNLGDLNDYRETERKYNDIVRLTAEGSQWKPLLR